MTVKIVISRGVHVYAPPKKLRRIIIKDLTFENKSYADAVKHGRYIGADVLPYHYFFNVNAKKKYIYTPRGYIRLLLKRIKNLGLPYEIVDKTLTLAPIELKFTGKPRDYQEEAIHKLMKFPCDVLEAGTGSGKTFMAINMIALRKQPTLIIVHSKELLHQWVKSIEDWLKVPVGVVGDGKYEIEDITVGIVNSVRNKINQLQLKFGHIILDECHRCPATMWTETLQQFPAKYYLGLSATAFRNDGLSDAINYFIGPTMHTVDQEHLHKTGAVLKPKIFQIRTRFTMPPRSDYSKVIKKLTENGSRNSLIVNTAIHDLKYFKRPILIVSDRVKHCEVLSEMIEAQGYTTSVLVSKKSDNDRLQAVEDIRDGRSMVLIATTQLISEGFDAPNLHALFLAMPIKYAGKVIQLVGRILRPDEKKVPRLYDFRDDSIWMLKKQGTERNKTYKEKWG